MTVAGLREKCNALLSRIPRDLFVVSAIILASTASFGLGYLAGRDAGQGMPLSRLPEDTALAARNFVASKNGTRYYPSDCSGAGRISEANQVWFAAEADARAAGYLPAANCAGR